MRKRTRLLMVLALILVSSVGLLNLAVFWHGAVFIAATPAWAWLASKAIDWAIA